MHSLSEKVIIVTGSSSGIGHAIATGCAAQGARVLVHGSIPAKVEAVVREIGSDRAAGIAADLADPESPERIVKAAVDRFGRLDGLVNNAGIFPRNTIESADIATFDHIMAVNLRAPMFLAQAAVRQFRSQHSPGSIVNIGSINAYTGQPDLLIYSVSKGGLMTMTRNLADALGTERIRVNQMNVGWTLTETEDATQRKEGRPANWPELIPLVFAPSGSILRPEQIAPHVVFWLSDASAPVSGSVYEVEQYPVIGRNRAADS